MGMIFDCKPFGALSTAYERTLSAKCMFTYECYWIFTRHTDMIHRIHCFNRFNIISILISDNILIVLANTILIEINKIIIKNSVINCVG